MRGAEEKHTWVNVGQMTQFDNGNMIVEIPAIGLTASVFPDDRKPLEKPEFIKAQESQPAPSEPSVNVEDEDINPDDIPF